MVAMPTVRLIFSKGLHHDMMARERYAPARQQALADACARLVAVVNIEVSYL